MVKNFPSDFIDPRMLDNLDKLRFPFIWVIILVNTFKFLLLSALRIYVTVYILELA